MSSHNAILGLLMAGVGMFVFVDAARSDSILYVDQDAPGPNHDGIRGAGLVGEASCGKMTTESPVNGESRFMRDLDPDGDWEEQEIWVADIQP